MIQVASLSVTVSLKSASAELSIVLVVSVEVGCGSDTSNVVTYENSSSPPLLIISMLGARQDDSSSIAFSSSNVNQLGDALQQKEIQENQNCMNLLCILSNREYIWMIDELTKG